MDTTKLPKTSKEARKLGLKYYFPGTACKHGHIALRYAASHDCKSCVGRKYKENREKLLPVLKARYHANKERYQKRRRKREFENPKRYWATHVLKNAKIRAAKAGVAFDIDLEYLLSITPDLCPVFGTPFIFIGNGSVCLESATIDRMVPAKGYVRGNVVVISQFANTIKSNATAREVERVAEWMKEHGL